MDARAGSGATRGSVGRFQPCVTMAGVAVRDTWTGEIAATLSDTACAANRAEAWAFLLNARYEHPRPPLP